MAFCCWFIDFVKCSLSRTQKFRVTGCRSLMICWFYIGLLQSAWVLIVRFAVDLLIFEMAENWKVLVTSFKTLLICWFVELLSCWAVELLSCWVVELLSCWAVELLSAWSIEPFTYYFSNGCVRPKNSELPVAKHCWFFDLIFYSLSGSIDSAFCCWFVDF